MRERERVCVCEGERERERARGRELVRDQPVRRTWVDSQTLLNWTCWFCSTTRSTGKVSLGEKMSIQGPIQGLTSPSILDYTERKGMGLPVWCTRIDCPHYTVDCKPL